MLSVSNIYSVLSSVLVFFNGIYRPEANARHIVWGSEEFDAGSVKGGQYLVSYAWG